MVCLNVMAHLDESILSDRRRLFMNHDMVVRLSLIRKTIIISCKRFICVGEFVDG